MTNVTAAADPPAIDILAAPQKTFLLETKATVAPTISNAVMLNIELSVTAKLSVMKKYGAIGIIAPIENEKNELMLAPHGDPSWRGFNPNFSLIWNKLYSELSIISNFFGPDLSIC